MLQYSTGLVNSMMGKQATPKAFMSGTTLSYVYGGGSVADNITHSGSGFITAGFSPGDIIYTHNSTTSGNNLVGVPVVSVTAAALTLGISALAASEAFPAAGCIFSCTGGSVRDVFANGVIRIFGGSPPSTADAAITGTLLVEISLASGAFVGGAPANGIHFGTAVAGVLAKATSEVWSGVGAANGTATHYRLVGNASDTNGISTTLPRVQGSISTSGADLNMSSTTIIATPVAETTTISTFSYTLIPS